MSWSATVLWWWWWIYFICLVWNVCSPHEPTRLQDISKGIFLLQINEWFARHNHLYNAYVWEIKELLCVHCMSIPYCVERRRISWKVVMKQNFVGVLLLSYVWLYSANYIMIVIMPAVNLYSICAWRKSKKLDQGCFAAIWKQYCTTLPNRRQKSI
jgi:hypothetical protein